MSEEHRSLSGNCVLLRDDVGKAKPTIFNLPHQGHAYGRCDEPDAEGAREVTMNWASHVPRRRPGPSCQDFRQLNRLAAKNGVTDARQLKEWRVHNDVKLVPKNAVGALPKVIPSDVIPSFAYGIKSRPSTPIAGVVGYQFGREQEELLSFNYKKMAEENGRPGGKRVVKLTVASRQQISNARSARHLVDSPPEYKEPFKLSKFKKVQGKMTKEEMGRSASAPTLVKVSERAPTPAAAAAAECNAEVLKIPIPVAAAAAECNSEVLKIPENASP